MGSVTAVHDFGPILNGKFHTYKHHYNWHWGWCKVIINTPYDSVGGP